MICDLAYRCVPRGEIIHTTYDTVEQIVGYMPETVCDKTMLRRDPEDAPYQLAKELNMPAVEETFLEYDLRCWCIYVYLGMYFIVCKKDGFTMAGYSLEEMYQKDEYLTAGMTTMLNEDNFKAIGYRLTRPLQCRYRTVVYSLTYDIVRNKVITNDGDLDIDLDVNTLSEQDPKCRGYKDMVRENAYALVYINGSPTLLYKDGNRLIRK